MGATTRKASGPGPGPGAEEEVWLQLGGNLGTKASTPAGQRASVTALRRLASRIGPYGAASGPLLDLAAELDAAGVAGQP